MLNLGTKYFDDKNHQNLKGYRLHTIIPKGKGFVVVGVDVKKVNQGKNKPVLEINSISTVFGKDGGITGFEEEIYRSENINPQQAALLERPNSSQYPSVGDFSGKDTKNFATDKKMLQTAQNRSGKPQSAPTSRATLPYSRKWARKTLPFPPPKPSARQREGGRKTPHPRNHNRGHKHHNPPQPRRAATPMQRQRVVTQQQKKAGHIAQPFLLYESSFDIWLLSKPPLFVPWVSGG
ncbi:MAG: hypothetical protein IJQ89_00425 [Bacteroidales bacterium]|nr:hypothetical protein [Bacteroidales bacterium]